jgi:hypothetical protein
LTADVTGVVVTPVTTTVAVSEASRITDSGH